MQRDVRGSDPTDSLRPRCSREWRLTRPATRASSLATVAQPRIDSQASDEVVSGMFGAFGVSLGLLGGFAIARALTSLLYRVTSTDPATYGGVAHVAMALVASAWPAWRATRVDPIRTLKAE